MLLFVIFALISSCILNVFVFVLNNIPWGSCLIFFYFPCFDVRVHSFVKKRLMTVQLGIVCAQNIPRWMGKRMLQCAWCPRLNLQARLFAQCSVKCWKFCHVTSSGAGCTFRGRVGTGFGPSVHCLLWYAWTSLLLNACMVRLELAIKVITNRLLLKLWKYLLLAFKNNTLTYFRCEWKDVIFGPFKAA